MKKPSLLLVSGTGYMTNDNFLPLIASLGASYSIHMLQIEDYLSKETDRRLHAFLEEGKLKAIHTLPPLKRNTFYFSYHRWVKQLLESLKKTTFDAFLMGTDFYPLDRYLISLAREKGTKVVLMNTTVPDPVVLDNYRVSLGHAPAIKKGSFLSKFSFRRVVQVWGRLVKAYYRLMNFRVWPWVFTGQVFWGSGYDKFKFSAGRGDATLFFDRLDMESYRHAVPVIKKPKLIRHPAMESRLNPKTTVEPHLLALLVTYPYDPEEEKINFWIKSLKQIVDHQKIEEVHLRFHPRTNKAYTWPKRLVEGLTNAGVNFRVVPSDDKPLIETVQNYKVVVGAFSGSTRMARWASKDSLVFWLQKAGIPCDYEDKWCLGAADGIQYIHYKEDIKPDHFKNDTSVFTNLPSAKDVLDEMYG